MSELKLFTHDECSQCVVVRKFLHDHDIRFQDVDIERTPGALDELVELTGSATHVPVISVGEETFIDFDEYIARRLLEMSSRSSTS